MRDIYGLSNHEDLSELLKRAETRIEENSLDEALTHMRKAVEYMVQQFVRENPDCAGKDLSEMMHNLEGAGILKRGDANVLHQIRKKGNTVGAHVTEEEITVQQAKQLFDELLEYVPKFLEAIPYPSTKQLKSNGRLSVDFDHIPPLEMGIKPELVRQIMAEKSGVYEERYGCIESFLYFNRGKKESDFPEEDVYYFILVPEEFIYQTRDGKFYINRSEYARYYDKKVRKIVSAKKPLECDSEVLIPGMLQEYFGFSKVYQDGITPAFSEPNGNHIVSELSLYAKEIRLPDSVTHVTYPTTYWYIDGSTENYSGTTTVGGNAESIVLSNQLSEDCHFCWTEKVPADKISLNPGAKGTISVKDGSIYSADGKKLIYARMQNGVFAIPEGVEVIGKNAFEKDTIRQLSFPGSLRKIEAGALQNYGEDELILPDFVTDIDEKAFQKSQKVFYESDHTVNINPQYGQYLKEQEEARKREQLARAEAERQERVRRARQELEEQQRKKKEEIARKEAEEKAKQEKKQEQMRFVRLGVLVAAVLIVIVILLNM